MTTDYDESVWCEVRLTGSDKLLVAGVYIDLQTVTGEMMSILTQHYRKQTAQDTVMYLFVVTLTTRSELERQHSPTDVNHPASLFMEAVRDSFLVQHVTEQTRYR